MKAGASNDIERVTTMARNMVMRYGMSEALGPMTFGSDSSEVFLGMSYTQNRDYSEQVAAEIDEEVRKIVDKAYQQCVAMLTENMTKLHNVANALIALEKLDSDSFDEIFELDELKEQEYFVELEQIKTESKAAEETEPASMPEGEAAGEPEIKPEEENEDSK